MQTTEQRIALEQVKRTEEMEQSKPVINETIIDKCRIKSTFVNRLNRTIEFNPPITVQELNAYLA